MTAPLIFNHTREPNPMPAEDGRFLYLSDADDRVVRGWPRPEGQLWDRLAEVGHDHDPGGCTCGCPVPGCERCGGSGA